MNATVNCACCNKRVPEDQSFGDGDMGDDSIPSFCSRECYDKGPAPIHVSAVALDETRYYSIAEADKPLIKAIKSVYIYNRDERTFCCEITPSHYLEYLYTYVEYADEPSDEVQDHITTTYCYEPTDDFYMHCHVVKRLAESKDCGSFESMQEAREYLQGNWPI